MDLGRGLTFVLDDPDWWRKLLIGGVIAFIPLAGIFIWLGYFRELYLRLWQGVELPLPEWDHLADKLGHGFRIFFACLVYILPLVAFYFLMFLVAMLTIGLDDQGTVFAVTMVLFVLLYVVWSFYLMIVMPAIFIAYFRSGSITAAVSPVRHWSIIRAAGSRYWVALVMGHLAYFLAGFGVLLCFVGVLFTTFWANLSFFHYYAQCENPSLGRSTI